MYGVLRRKCIHIKLPHMATSLDGTLLRTSMHTHFLNEPPACILIAPSDPTLVVIGTYLYVPDEGKKSGNLLLYRKPKDNSSLCVFNSHIHMSEMLGKKNKKLTGF